MSNFKNTFGVVIASAILCAAIVFVFTGNAPKEMIVKDAYARANGASAKAGGAFMQIRNNTGHDDRLIAVKSPIAMAEIHSHIHEADGVMRMVELEDGIAIAAGETIELKRGGDHLMLMGLQRGLVQGDTVDFTLTFEHAGDVKLTVPVDLER
ncbi:hypothetical protein GCM10008927_27590 [Amylibacter ulvae]|uniref:Copper-binding protein n=1 Tax=Paramylibacter ulvae TaxID=1651968 RepID=A0ABQ3DBC8_9RHOB|nr:copper chaperone PCu(A)C [Amylibacter ulvae]GHA60542.1 hypothetical protein GCM10008927_27590 [Amylibacter ulvae]